MPIPDTHVPLTEGRKSATTDRAHHVGSLSGLITIVVMILVLHKMSIGRFDTVSFGFDVMCNFRAVATLLTNGLVGEPVTRGDQNVRSSASNPFVSDDEGDAFLANYSPENNTERVIWKASTTNQYMRLEGE